MQQADKSALDAATDRLERARAIATKLGQSMEAQERQAGAAAQVAADANQQWLDGLGGVLRRARFDEDRLLGMREFKTADYDAARAKLDLAVQAERDAEEIRRLQRHVQQLKEGEGGLDQLTLAYQAAADHRQQLQRILDEMTADRREISQQLNDNSAELNRLTAALAEKKATFVSSGFPFLGKRLLELPILDAFNSPLKIDNLWTENLTIENGSFGRVRRFDRCTTCHRAIDKTLPATADEPAFLSEQDLLATLPTPPSPPQPAALTLQDVYGIGLAEQGLVDDQSVTIDYVRPRSPAATAQTRLVQPQSEQSSSGLRVGDVLVYVNDDRVVSPQQVRRFLLETVAWGQPIEITVRRGLPQPYSSHPRLDLFVGSLSPHPISVMGCTVCHEGQGSATAFKWASHTPNTPLEAHDWAQQHDWFDNHHWIYPMYPRRFAESACLKCHHELTELEPSDRYPDPPAPKLLHGYDLLSKYGCFGCHEIHGFNGPDQRLGPDLAWSPIILPRRHRCGATRVTPNCPPTSRTGSTSLCSIPNEMESG